MLDEWSTDRILCLHVVSYAFSRSKETQSTSCLAEKAVTISEEKRTRESVVLLILRKPLWGINIWYAHLIYLSCGLFV